MKEILERFRMRELIGVEGLVDAATEIIQEIAPILKDGKIIDAPNIRTARYYISEDILPAATEKRGHSSLFRYPHLLALLNIKWFQTQGLPISVIKDALRHMTVEQMEKAFGERVQVFTDPSQMRSFIETHGRRDDEDLVVLRDPVARGEYLEQLSSKLPEDDYDAPDKTLSEEESASKAGSIRAKLDSSDEVKTHGNTNDGLWRRKTICCGLEVHIEGSFRPPETEEERELVVREFEKLLDGESN